LGQAMEASKDATKETWMDGVWVEPKGWAKAGLKGWARRTRKSKIYLPSTVLLRMSCHTTNNSHYNCYVNITLCTHGAAAETSSLEKRRVKGG